MSELFTLTEDRAGDEEIRIVTFDPIPVGDVDTERFFIQNDAPARLSVEKIETETDGPGEITVEHYPENISEYETGEVLLRASSVNTTTLKGLEAEIEIEASAIIYP